MSHSLHLVCVAIGVALLLTLATHHARGETRPRHAWLLPLPWLGLALVLTSYLSKGHLIPGDGHSHLGRTWLTFDALKHGELPLWSNRWYMGFPLDLYNGPLYYMLAAVAVALTFGKLYFATKLLLWALHLGAAAAVYRLGILRYGERGAASVLVLGYTLAGYHVDSVRTDGKLSMALVFLSAPFLFSVSEQLRRDTGDRLPKSLWAALWLAFGLASHIQYGAYLALAYLASSALDGLLASGPQRVQVLRHVAESALGALGLSAWLLVPTIRETGFLTLAASDAGIALNAFSLERLAQHIRLMLTPMLQRPRFLPGYLGLSLVALALFATFRPARDASGRRFPSYPFTLMALGLVGVCLGQGRFDFLIFLGVSVLAADGFASLSGRFSFRYLAPVVTVVLLLDLGAGLLKDEYARHDSKPYDQVRDALQKSGVPGRVLSLYRNKTTFWPSLDGFPSNLSTPLGSLPQLSTRSLGYTLAIATHLAEELIDQKLPLSQPSLDLLQIMGVRYLLVGDRHRRIEARARPPLLFAPALEHAEPDLGLEGLSLAAAAAFWHREIPTDHVLRLAAKMGLSPGEPSAQRLLVLGDELLLGTPVQSAATSAEPAALRVSQFAEKHASVSFRYQLAQPGYLRLAYSHAPFGHMELDGLSVPFSRDAFGALVVAAPSGSHQLKWSVGVSPLRVRMFAFSALSALVLLGLYVQGRRARARQGA